jgi:hypothetical protein
VLIAVNSFRKPIMSDDMGLSGWPYLFLHKIARFPTPIQGSHMDPLVSRCIPQANMPLFQTFYGFHKIFQVPLLTTWSTTFSMNIHSIISQDWIIRKKKLLVCRILQSIKNMYKNILTSYLHKNVSSMVWRLSLLEMWHLSFFWGTDATLCFLANKHSNWLKPTQK